jgi:hypothetical protein
MANEEFNIHHRYGEKKYDLHLFESEKQVVVRLTCYNRTNSLWLTKEEVERLKAYLASLDLT